MPEGPAASPWHRGHWRQPRVVALQPAIGGHRAATLSVGARIHHHDAVAVAEQQLRLTRHARAVIRDAVKKQHPAAIRLSCVNLPSAQHRSVRCVDDEVFLAGARLLKHAVAGPNQFRRERPHQGVKYPPAQHYANCGRTQEREHDQAAQHIENPPHISVIVAAYTVLFLFLPLNFMAGTRLRLSAGSSA